jgi:putative ABC transport system ATP-binding protein
MIKLENISKIYRSGRLEVCALNRIKLEMEKGEFISIMGPSGSGKSTLLQIIGCLDRPSSGSYFFEGKEVENLSENELAEIRNRKVGFVFQFFNLSPYLTVLRNLELPLIFGGIGSDKYRLRTAMKMLYLVGLPEKANFRANEISGGQQQKVAIARALINKPALLLADEPTGNLDTKSGERILGLLKELNEAGMSVIISTHDENIAKHSRRIIHLRDGEMIKDEKV